MGSRGKTPPDLPGGVAACAIQADLEASRTLRGTHSRESALTPTLRSVRTGESSIKRISLGFALLCLPLAAALPAPDLPDAPPVRLPDGFTALLAPVGSLGGYLFETEDVRFEIILYEKDGTGEWRQVARPATARASVYDAEGEHDVFSQPFTSAASGRVTVTMPGELVDDQPFDFWVTMWRPDETYPTSHYSLHKNMLVVRGEYDAAEAFDYHHGPNPIRWDRPTG